MAHPPVSLFPDAPTSPISDSLRQASLTTPAPQRGISLFPDTTRRPEDEALQQSRRLSLQTPPDQAARVRRLQAATGLPRELIMSRINEVEAATEMENFDAARYRALAPATSAWLAANPDNMAVASDDLTQLRTIEAYFTSLHRGFGRGRIMGDVGVLGQHQRENRGQLSAGDALRLSALERQLAQQPVGRNFVQDVLYHGGEFAGQMVDIAPDVAAGYVGGAVVGASLGALGGPAAPITVLAGSQIGGAVGSAYGAAKGVFRLESGLAYRELKQALDDNGQALPEGMVRNASRAIGVLNSGLEVISLSVWAAPFIQMAQRFTRGLARDALTSATMRRALTRMGVYYGKAMGTEVTTEIAQELNNVIIGDLMKSASQGDFQTVFNSPTARIEMVERLAQTAEATAKGMLLIGLPGASVTLAHNVSLARQAQRRVDFFTALGEDIADSKSFQRLPEGLQEIVKRKTEGTPIADLYVDAQPLLEYFQKQKLNPFQMMAQVLEDPTEFQSAVEQGLPVRIPMHLYATKLAPTDHNAFLVEEIRLGGPDVMNAREAQEALDEAESLAQDIPDEELTAEAEFEQRTTEIAEQLVATGRVTPENARAQAKQQAAFYMTVQQRTGIDPKTLYEMSIGSPALAQGIATETAKTFPQGKSAPIVFEPSDPRAWPSPRHKEALREYVLRLEQDADQPAMQQLYQWMKEIADAVESVDHPTAQQTWAQVPPQMQRWIKTSSQAAGVWRWVEQGDAMTFWQRGKPAWRAFLPGFYSKAEALVEKEMGGKASRHQLEKLFEKIKADEREWLSIPTFLSTQETFTKEEVKEHLYANRLNIQHIEPRKGKDMHQLAQELEEVSLRISDEIQNALIAEHLTEHSEGQGEEEVFIYKVDRLSRAYPTATFDSRDQAEEYIGEYVQESDELQDQINTQAHDEVQVEENGDVDYEEYTLSGGSNYEEHVFTLPDVRPGFNEGHFSGRIENMSDEVGKLNAITPANDFAHARSKHRITQVSPSESLAMLFVEEIQSDWHQQGRDFGYLTPEETLKLETLRSYYDSLTRTAGASFTALAKRLSGWSFDRTEEQWGSWVATVRENSVQVGGDIVRGMEQAEERGVTTKYREEFNEMPVELQTMIVDYVNTWNVVYNVFNEAQLLKAKFPNAPFKKTWHEFVFKAMLREAVQNGKEAIGWTTGDQQNARYHREKTADEVILHAPSEKLRGRFAGNYEVELRLEGAPRGFNPMKRERLSSFLGSQLSERLLAELDERVAVGLAQHGLKLDEAQQFGGSGMRGFYDKILVDYANKLGNKYGVKVEKLPIQVGEYGYAGVPPDPANLTPQVEQVHVLRIPEAMRNMITEQGFELFQRGKREYKKAVKPSLPEVLTSEMRKALVKRLRQKAKQETHFVDIARQLFRVAELVEQNNLIALQEFVQAEIIDETDEDLNQVGHAVTKPQDIRFTLSNYGELRTPKYRPVLDALEAVPPQILNEEREQELLKSGSDIGNALKAKKLRNDKNYLDFKHRQAEDPDAPILNQVPLGTGTFILQEFKNLLKEIDPIDRKDIRKLQRLHESNDRDAAITLLANIDSDPYEAIRELAPNVYRWIYGEGFGYTVEDDFELFQTKKGATFLPPLSKQKLTETLRDFLTLEELTRADLKDLQVGISRNTIEGEQPYRVSFFWDVGKISGEDNDLRALQHENFATYKDALQYVTKDLGYRLTEEFEQETKGEEEVDRGKASFQGMSINIELFEQANFSTFLHESGHVYLAMLTKLVHQEGVTGQVAKDLLRLQKAIGAQEGATSYTREQHETFARLTEAYFRQGKAPSARLKEAFFRFRAWLHALYRSMQDLGVELTPEVSDVFDRMFATDQEIAAQKAEAEATPLFTTADDAGMTDDEFAVYKKSIEKGHHRAVEQLQTKLMRDAQKQFKTEYREAKQEITEAVTAEINIIPGYRALMALQLGLQPDGTPLETPLKIDRAALVAERDEDFVRELPLPVIYATEGGVSLQEATELLGFTSPDALLTEISTLPPRKTAIRDEVQKRLKAKFGDLLTDGRLPEAGKAAVLNEYRENIIQAELRALRTKQRQVEKAVKQKEKVMTKAAKKEADANKRWADADQKMAVAIERGAQQAEIDELQEALKSLETEKEQALKHAERERAYERRFLDAEAKRAEAEGGELIAGTLQGGAGRREAREQARLRISRLKIMDIKPHRYWTAARRASQAAIVATAKKDYVTAANAKQAELLAVALYREAVRVKDTADAVQRRTQRLQSKGVQERLGKSGSEYREQINGLLERFDFAPISNKAIKRRASLAAFVKSQTEKHLPVNIPDDLLAETFKMPWKEMTIDELIMVDEALQHIDHLSKLKMRMLRRDSARSFAEARDTIAARIKEKAKRTLKPELETHRPSDVGKRLIRGFFAAHRKFASIVREMDGWEDGGPLWELLVRPLNAMTDEKTTLNIDMTEKLYEIFHTAFPDTAMHGMHKRQAMPTLNNLPLSREGRLMMALHWGAIDNRAKLLSGLSLSLKRPVSENDVWAVLDTLSAPDWIFVEKVWAYVDTHWKPMKALSERLDGVAPEKIAAAPVQTRFGTKTGGYMPIKYDDRQSTRVRQNVLDRQASKTLRAGTTRASTKAGSRNERVSDVQLPLRLDFGALFEHLEEVSLDLTHTEGLIDLNRLLRSDEVEDAIRTHHGEAKYTALLDTLRDIAAGDAPAQNWFDHSLNWVRRGSSLAALAWNTGTAMLQPLGIFNSIVRLGGPVEGTYWVAKGIKRWLRDATSMEEGAAWVQEVSPFMRHRHRTFLREIDEIRNRIGVASSNIHVYLSFGVEKATLDKIDLQDLQDSFFWIIAKMQVVADMPTWLGAYEKAMADNSDEARAIAMADQAVIDSQSTGQLKDLAAVQRGNPALKLWTNFYTFFSAVWQLHVEAVKKTDFKSPLSIGRLAGDLLLLSVVPAILGKAMRDWLRGDDEEDDPKKAMAAEVLSYLANMLVGVRELTGVIQGFYGYGGPAGGRIFNEAGKLIQQVAQGALDLALWKTLNQTAGILLHYPAAQIQRTILGLQAFLEGEASPLAILFGPPRK